MDFVRPNREPFVAAGQIEHHVADLSATFAADVTLAAAQAKLREQSQWLPIDGDPSSGLAVLIERNSTGPLRLGFGAWRDLLLGAQFRNGADELITAGGRTVKNVAGYDLTKFMVGQYGIFGKLVTVTTRAYRAPEFALLATFAPDVKKLNALLATPSRPQWAMLTKDALLFGYLGDRATADFYEQNVPQHGTRDLVRHTLDDDINLRAKLWAAKMAGDSFRAMIPPARIAEFVELTQIANWSADAAFGVIVGSCPTDQRPALERAAKSVDGSVIFFDASGAPQNLSIEPGVASLLKRIKHSFDPNNQLNPLPLHAT